MIEHTVKMHLIPWDDPAFHDAVCEAWDRIRAEHMSVDRRDAAARAEAELRRAGYEEARVEYSRTVEDVMSCTAQWTVHRDARH